VEEGVREWQMLREQINRLYISLLLGVSCGSAYFYLINHISSDDADYLVYPFALQLLFVTFIQSESPWYLVLSVAHFIFLFWVLGWLFSKKLSVMQWVYIFTGYAIANYFAVLFSLYIYVYRYYLFVGVIMMIGFWVILKYYKQVMN
jgi:hypothetical protein